MTTIMLPILDCINWKFEPVFQATLLPDIAPHLASVATFAVHKASACLWHVSNVETGTLVSVDMKKEKAIANAKERLSRVSAERIEIAMDKAMMLYFLHHIEH